MKKVIIIGMKKLFLSIFTSIFIIGFSVTTPLLASTAMAIGEGGAPSGINAARGDNVPSNLANGDQSIVRRVINLMLYGVGALSVIMLIFGGFRYIVSGGKKESVTNAKNTILYAIIGLLISLFAYAIINFVVSTAIGGGSTTDI